jgi:hypothetical protein
MVSVDNSTVLEVVKIDLVGAAEVAVLLGVLGSGLTPSLEPTTCSRNRSRQSQRAESGSGRT